MKVKKTTRSALFSLCLCSLPLALTPAAFAANDFGARLDQFIAQHKLPGAVALIKQGDTVLHYSAHGKVNVEQSQLMQKEAIFRIFSMGKPIVAFAVLQLVDQGKLSLDDDIRQYLPRFEPFEFDGKPQVVTVHQLLSHTAGFGYGGGFKSWADIRYLLANPLSRSNTLDDLVDDISGIALKFAPGEKWQYSIASDVQGALIEAVSGMTLDHYLKARIFAPLKMHDTGFYVPQEKAHRLVDQYEYDAEGLAQLKSFNAEEIQHSEFGQDSEYLQKPLLLSGGGGLVSTATDYSRFVATLLNGGRFQDKRLLSSKLTSLMLSSHTQGLDTWFLPKLYNSTGFGYGLGVKEAPGGLRQKGSFYWAGMGGTVFWADPANDLQVVVMMQVEDGWVALEKWLIPEVYQLIQSGTVKNTRE